MKIRFVSELYKAKQNIRGILDAAKNAALQCSLLVSRSFSGTSFVRNPFDAQCNAMKCTVNPPSRFCSFSHGSDEDVYLYKSSSKRFLEIPCNAQCILIPNPCNATLFRIFSFLSTGNSWTWL